MTWLRLVARGNTFLKFKAIPAQAEVNAENIPKPGRQKIDGFEWQGENIQ